MEYIKLPQNTLPGKFDSVHNKINCHLELKNNYYWTKYNRPDTSILDKKNKEKGRVENVISKFT